MRQTLPICIGAAFALIVTTDVSAQVHAGTAPSGVTTDTVVLSLGAAQQLALRRNPDFLADRREIAIAQGQFRQARTYALNPDISATVPGAVSGGEVGEYEVTLMQEVEWAGQWGLRSGAARLGVERAEHGVRNAARTTLTAVSRAYLEALAADRRFGVSTAVLELNERLLSATRTQLREGEISALEANLAEIEFGRARARVLAARRDAESTALELKRIAGLADGVPLRLVDDSTVAPDPRTLAADSLLAVALLRRPDLAASGAAVRQLEALRRLAGREGIPNLRVGVVADRDAPGDPSRLGIGIGLALPLWNRSRGLVAERLARAEQAVLQLQATELRVRSDVTAAVRQYASASEETAVYEASVLRPARENQALLDTAYRAGKVNLPTLLLLRNQLLDAELGYWDAWLARRTALIALQAATGTLMPDGAMPTNEIEVPR